MSIYAAPNGANPLFSFTAIKIQLLRSTFPLVTFALFCSIQSLALQHCSTAPDTHSKQRGATNLDHVHFGPESRRLLVRRVRGS